jgi:hypothetical protein
MRGRIGRFEGCSLRKVLEAAAIHVNIAFYCLVLAQSFKVSAVAVARGQLEFGSPGNAF